MRKNIMIFILYFNIIIQVLSENEIKVSDCEKLIKASLKQIIILFKILYMTI